MPNGNKKRRLSDTVSEGDKSNNQQPKRRSSPHFTGSTSIDHSNSPPGIQALMRAEETMHSAPDSIENRLLQGSQTMGV